MEGGVLFCGNVIGCLDDNVFTFLCDYINA